jgi:hypothetical protein
MKTIEYTFFDKSKWEQGSWTNEIDKKQFVDKETGLPCLIVRAPHMGNLCGYVGVLPGHPLYGKDRFEISGCLSVHGGVNFAEACQKSDEDYAVCHIPDPGESDNVWWIGFDCGHAHDLTPFMSKVMIKYFGAHGAVYRDVAYVEKECARLAKQLKRDDFGY